jgi:predicted O-methyltransferase YrrM
MIYKFLQMVRFYFKRLKLPYISYASVMDNCNISLVETVDVPGGMTLEELVILIGICKKKKTNTLLEIGSFRGRTTINIAKNCPDCEITTFDLPLEKSDMPTLKHPLNWTDKPLAAHIHRGFFIQKYTDLSDRITCLFGDSATYDFTPYYNLFDIVIIDASHSYKNVMIDSDNALKLLRDRKGIIIWHDYALDHNEVVKAVHDVQRKYGIKIFHIKRTKFAYAEVK